MTWRVSGSVSGFQRPRSKRTILILWVGDNQLLPDEPIRCALRFLSAGHRGGGARHHRGSLDDASALFCRQPCPVSRCDLRAASAAWPDDHRKHQRQQARPPEPAQVARSALPRAAAPGNGNAPAIAIIVRNQAMGSHEHEQEDLGTPPEQSP
jgi:hypothetical protein